MKNKIIQQILHSQERLQQKNTRFFQRMFYFFALLIHSFLYGAYSAGHLLFGSRSNSFSVWHDQDTTGKWNGSYTEHIQFQRGIRLFSFTSVLTVMTSVFIVFGIMEVLFPYSNISPVFAYDNTFTVSNTNDLGPGSLRKAISDANGATGSVEIVLSPITLTITLDSPLPTLTHPVTFTNDSMATVLRIDGQGLAAGTDCWALDTGSDGTIIVGLAFAYCPGDGLAVGDVSNITIGGATALAKDRVYAYGAGEDGIEFGGSYSTIQRTIVGYPVFSLGGEPDSNNVGNGISVSGDFNTITNVIAVDSNSSGIFVESTASGNTIANSNIGQYTLGATEYLGNGVGVSMYGDSNTVSSSTILYNGVGVYVHDSSDGTIIVSSYIGTDADSVTGQGNTEDGIQIYGTNTVIGGTTAEKNVISGNAESGLFVSGVVTGATGTIIKSNYIGTNVAGTAALANTDHGIFLSSVEESAIGVAGNIDVVSVISGNGKSGIYILDGSDIDIFNTIIGLSADQGTAIGNTESGIRVNTGSNISIGSSSSTADSNVISSNGTTGVVVSTGTTTGVYGGTIASNAGNGILLLSSTGTTIQHVSVTGNGGSFVDATSESGMYFTDNTMTTVTDNTISGSALHGIEITEIEGFEGGTGYIITSNTIIDNAEDGVYASGSTTSGVKISKNTFSSNGENAIMLANSANESVTAPTLIGAGSDLIQGTGGISGGSVEVYANGVYIAEDTSIDSSGVWSVGSTDAFSAYNAQRITALNINSSNNTSQFGTARELTTTAATLTVTDTQTFTESLDVTATLSLPGTLYYTTDNSTPTTSSTSTTAPLSFTVNDTTTVKLFGVDVNGNTTATQSKTYTKESDADSGEDDFDDDDDGEVDNPQEQVTLEAPYLKTANSTLNQQQVYEETLPLYIPFIDARIAGKNANNNHQVNVLIKDKNKEIVDQEWVDVEQKKWKKTVSVTLEKGEEYTVHGKARKKEDHTTVSSVKTLATVIASNPAPAIMSLTDAVTITAKTKNMLLTGLVQSFADGARFIFQNDLTGAVVDDCEATVNPGESTRSAACRLTNTLPVGVYNVLFQSMQQFKGNILPSTPAVVDLIVTRPNATTVFNTDSRSTLFYNRITTSSLVQVVGLGPKGSTVQFFIDDARVGEAVVSETDIGWSYDLDLSGYARGHNYLLEVKFFDTKGNEYDDSLISFPFRYANAVTKPAVAEALATFVVQDATLNVSVLGGSGHTLNVSNNGALLYQTMIDQNQKGVLATTAAVLPTESLGRHTITLQSEDNTGLLSAKTTFAYTVIAPTVVQVETLEEKEITPAPVNITPEQEAEEEILEQPVTQDPLDTTHLPEEWKTPATDEQEKEVITARLNTQNRINTAIVGQIEQVDVQGNRTVLAPAQKNSIGETILRTKKTLGLAPINLPWGKESASEQDVMTFNGVTDPYALVTVTIHSDPIVQITRADGEGKWTMTVLVDAIPPGAHTAYVQTESKGVVSEQVEIAKFVVIEQKKLSNTTWIFLINVVIAVLVLLVAITLQIRRKKGKIASISANNAPFSSPIQEAQDDAATDKKDDDDQKPPTMHSALGV